MFMPLSVRLARVVVFGVDCGEGPDKIMLLARYADAVEAYAADPTAAPAVPGNCRLSPTPVADVDLEQAVPGADLVVSTLGDEAVDRRIAEACRSHRVPVNVVDRRELCDVHFMSLIERPRLTLAVSTGGRCAFLARAVREELEPWARGWDDLAEVAVDARDALPPGLSRRERSRRLQLAIDDGEVRSLAQAGEIDAARRRAADLVAGEIVP